MKVIKKNVYYCDFCNKRMLSAWSMAKHEKHCTANPNRECRLCKNNPDIKTFIEELKSRFEVKETTNDNGFTEQKVIWKGKEITMNEIEAFTDSCPMCTFAILRQTKLNYSVFKFNYDFEKKLSEWWAEVNEREREYDERSLYY